MTFDSVPALKQLGEGQIGKVYSGGSLNLYIRHKDQIFQIGSNVGEMFEVTPDSSGSGGGGSNPSPPTGGGTITLKYDSDHFQLDSGYLQLVNPVPDGVQGDIIYHNGTEWTVLNAGEDGQFLQTQGTGANPQWTTVEEGGGGVTDHELLNNLDYASAGHTGFEPTVTKGNLTETISSVLSITGGTGAIIGSGVTIEVDQADTSNNGYLSSTDWNTFNSKQNALSFGNLTAGSTKVSIGGTGTGAVIGTGASVDVNEGNINHNSLLNTHNLTTDIDHNSITNTHNLTTSIDHNSITNTHNLTTDIDHDALTNFASNEHIDHSTVSVTAGTGMSGGGAINASVTLNCDITQYTDALARQSISESITGIDYNNSTGVFSITTGYGIPTTTQLSNADNAVLKDGTVQFTADYNIGVNKLGINIPTPIRKLDVLDTSNPQLRISHTVNSKYMDFQQLPTGNDFEMKSSTGYKAVYISDTYNSTYLGHYSNSFGGTGTYNTAVGYLSKQYNNGNYNTFVGAASGRFSSGTGNTGIGYNAGEGATGSYNIFLGYGAGRNLTTGSYNFILGAESALNLLTGSNVISFGYRAGRSLDAGNYNIYLGNNADYYRPPSGMTATRAVGGSIEVGGTGYRGYRVSFVVDGVETAPSIGYYEGCPYILVITGQQSANLANIPTYSGPGTCTARKIYRTKMYPPGTLTDFYLVDTIADNTTTTYSDAKADTSLGALLLVSKSSSIIIGEGSLSYEDNSFVAGSETAPINKVYFGEGVYSTTPSDTTLFATGGWGTNIAGADLIMQAGIATGNAEGGDYLVKTSDVGVSGISGQASTTKFGVYSKGNVVAGKQASVATDATDGFLYIPSGNGAPTGTPTAYTGKVAMYYDTANENLYIYNGGWVKITLA